MADKRTAFVQNARMSSTWSKALLVLGAIWLLAGGTIWWARNAKPTPESIARYVDAHPLDGQSEAERAKRLGKVAGQINGLDYETRREMRIGRKLDDFFKSLTGPEQARFLDLTLPEGFKQTMEALNKMPPEKRKKFVGQALDEMKKHEGDEPPDSVA